MPEATKRIVDLVLKHFKDDITESEKAELQAWLDTSDANRIKLDEMLRENLIPDLALWEESEMKFKELDRIRVFQELDREEPEIKVVPLQGRRWRIFIAAASVVFLLAAGTIYWLGTRAIKKESPVVASAKNDLTPGGNRATLKLANGTVVMLDSVRSGILSEQAGASVEKTADGKLAYNELNEKPSEVVQYNTLATPKGGQYFVELADGTKVWLNAASSLTYPTAFTGTERTVELKGEAYFEVAKNAAMPFQVKADDEMVQVLGTDFNVNAYRDEAAIKTTLLEGSIRISREDAATLLKPGEQAQVRENGAIKIIKDADVEQAIAWKNGYFQFKRDNLEEVLQQLTRWYDADVKYEGQIPEMQFGGRISRNNNLSEVLKILELSNVHFRIEGKTIVVMP